MRSTVHATHVRNLASYSACAECNADRERRFVCPAWPGYRYVRTYLDFARAGFGGGKVKMWWGGDILTPEQFRREFVGALQRRIYLRVDPPKGRKHSHGYLERLTQFRSRQDGRYWAEADYLREFARKGASAL